MPKKKISSAPVRPEKKFVISEPVLKGRTIYLEGLSGKHVSARYAGWLNDPDVCKETRHGGTRNTVARTRAYVRSVDRSPDTAVFAIMTRNDRKHIGNASLGVCWGADVAELSIMIGDKEYWGKGVATEAYRLIIDYAFRKLDLHKVKSGMTLTNKGMIRVAERAGMKKECVLREDAFLGTGKYVDIVQYMILNPRHGKYRKVGK